MVFWNITPMASEHTVISAILTLTIAMDNPM